MSESPRDGDPPVVITRIVFERDERGDWTATAETSAGDMVGAGPSIREARLALDLLLKKSNARAMPAGSGSDGDSL